MRLTAEQREGLRRDLAERRRAVEWAEAQLSADVLEARRRGLSWRDVGEALGVSHQAAHERYRLTDTTAVGLDDRPLPGT